MDKSILINKVDSIFNKIRNQKSDAWNLNINLWNWSCGVGLYGLVKVIEATGEEKYKDFISKWFDRNGGKRSLIQSRISSRRRAI